jgi:hypothetical protein
MRRTVLFAAALAGASILLRRSRRFGPLSAMALAALLEEVIPILRQSDAPTASKPSLWTCLTTRTPTPEPSNLRD